MSVTRQEGSTNTMQCTVVYDELDKPAVEDLANRVRKSFEDAGAENVAVTVTFNYQSATVSA